MEALRKPRMIHTKAMCVIVHDGKLLATRGFDEVKNENFYRLIGGGVHFQELAIDALKRELKEELETELENVSFLKVVESIFTYMGNPGHEVVFIYSADLTRRDLYEKEEIPIADHPSTIAVWVPIADIVSGDAKLYPSMDHSLLKTL